MECIKVTSRDSQFAHPYQIEYIEHPNPTRKIDIKKSENWKQAGAELSQAQSQLRLRLKLMI